MSEKIIDLQDQLDLERRMIDLGITRFQNSILDAEQSGRGDETDYARRLMANLIQPLAQEIKKFTSKRGPGTGKLSKKLIAQIPPEQAAYFILRGIFKYFTQEESIQFMCNEVGRYIEDELKFKQFNEQYAEYYKKIITDFRRKGTKNYRHMHRVLTLKANERKVKWKDWSLNQRISVGLKLLQLVIENTDLVEQRIFKVGSGKKSKTKSTLVPTKIAIDWVREYNSKMSLLNPNVFPCIIEPDNWVSLDQGGFYSPQLRSVYKLIKTRSKEHLKYLHTPELTPVMEAINSLQRTPWKVNTKVLDVLKIVWEQNLAIGTPPSEPYLIPEAPFPKTLKSKNMTPEQLQKLIAWKHEVSGLYTLETQRVSKCFQVLRVLQMGTEYQKYSRFWYVYYCDFRGRIYSATTSFSPQGPDFARGTLLFANGKPLGERGVHWLKIHGANCYGLDKESYEKRIKWIQEHTADIQAIAKDPIGCRNLWASADKPWQYLAFCFEYNDYLEQGDSFVSYLPINVDGSCNGLQNFSAMLRDSIGGKATNLLPSSSPSDIYSEVAKVCTIKLKINSDPEALHWIALCNKYYNGTLPRELSKKSVMTLPYGSTRHSCTDNILSFLMENHRDYFDAPTRFKLAVYLTPFLWDAINDVVIAARAAMSWLQKCSGILAKKNNPCVWKTPLGFTIYQGTNHLSFNRIETQLFGKIRFRLHIPNELKELSIIKQKQGIAPNFVHSMDSCHLMGTIITLSDNDIHDFICVHDEYGTHACNIDELQWTLRHIFVKLYTKHNVLQEFKDLNESLFKVQLPEIPSIGDLSLIDIMNSEYFFC